eukprot:Skav216948  [mRNA]  locus=scaffold3396:197642:204095:+ [translate_table: standard]
MPGNGLWKLFVQLIIWCSIFSTAHSVQLPLARHNEHRTAGGSPDCHIGSGDFEWTPCNHLVPAHGTAVPAMLTCLLRCGEAQNPGPSEENVVPFGFSNPGGIRNKEEVVLALGPGVWHFSETQLSVTTQRTFAARMKALAAPMHRSLRLHLGAAVAPRPGSEWAGTWAGVCSVSDHPSQELQLPYGLERQSGRVLTTCHFVHNFAVTTATVYGYPPGPTWPEAKTLTSKLLEPLSVNLVMGGHGPRIIGGDFNVGDDDLPCFALWRSLGWRSAQALALEWWDQPKTPTCKHTTERDLVWLSPEAQVLCRWVDVADLFADHAMVTVGLHIPSHNPRALHWPLPSKIPWDQVPADWGMSSDPPSWMETGSVDDQWRQLGATFESALDGHLKQQPQASLQRAQRGRLQRTSPTPRGQTTTFAKPSRPSEVQLRSDFAGSATKLWFQQLRRLQSYKAAILANKQTPCAIAYRVELWSAIRRSRGFDPDFPTWWSMSRTHDEPGTPRQLPLGPPGPEDAVALFQVFRSCFEAFENWHLRQRTQLLRSKYEAGMQGIFQDLRKDGRDQLDRLHSQIDYEVLAVDASDQLVQLDKPILMKGHSHWSWDDEPLAVQVIDTTIVSTPAAADLEHGHILRQHCVSFLSHCVRSFVIRNAHSDPLSSLVGMPEGDALSVYAMLQLDYAWHVYMTVFAPTVRSLSFVDNLMLTGSSAGSLARAWTCLETFFEMWNLQTDSAKTFGWATTVPLRQQMKAFPFQTVSAATELGGVLSFTRHSYTGKQKSRLEALAPKWLKLRRSQAPLSQKLAALPLVFWSAGLHGIAGSCLGQGQYDQLRTQAVRALRLNGAGSNPLLRLSLSTTPRADPGYWSLCTTVITFKRLLRKEPSLLNSWGHFMTEFDGKLFSGPCSQLLQAVNQIQWRVEVPCLVDHDGISFNLLQTDDASLQVALYDAWLQYVASTVTHRRTMSDLQGLDPHLVVLDHSQMTALDLSLQSALQSGAFLSAYSHAKFDMTKIGICEHCQVQDTQDHWLSCPRFQHLRDRLDGWEAAAEVDTTALTNHLLPSRSPWAAVWKEELMRLDQQQIEFLSKPTVGEQHIFSDGSCSGELPYQYGAWGCINASTGQLVALEHLGGLRQHSARAELAGALAVITWQALYQVVVHLWLDCKFVADGIAWILERGSAGDSWADADLWDQIVFQIHQLGDVRFYVHWIPSHLDSRLLECPFEDWCLEWNSRIDRIVGQHNMHRPASFWDLQQAAERWHGRVGQRLRHLRAFYGAAIKAQLLGKDLSTISLKALLLAPPAKPTQPAA